MAFMRSPVRSRSGPPTFAHACQRERELRLASHAKVVHRSGEAAKVGLSLMNELRLASPFPSPENLHQLFEFGVAETALSPSAR